MIPSSYGQRVNQNPGSASIVRRAQGSSSNQPIRQAPTGDTIDLRGGNEGVARELAREAEKTCKQALPQKAQ